VEGLDDSLHYRPAKSVKGYDDAAAPHMHEKAHHRILQFLLARFILLNLLINEAEEHGGVHPASLRRLWVFLQAQPTEMLEKDAFTEVAAALRTVSIEDLRNEIKDEYAKMKHNLESVHDPSTGELKRRPLYCFLDEIQITTTYRMGQYWGDDKTTQRPLLRPIWSTLTGVLQSTEMLLILSGTAIHTKSLEDVLNSSVFKPCRYQVWRDIGAFDDADAQKQYIECYLPGQRSEAWVAFLERAWGWCRGRYCLESSHRIDSYYFCSQVSQYSNPYSIDTCVWPPLSPQCT
jgi:hypothetical protein